MSSSSLKKRPVVTKGFVLGGGGGGAVIFVAGSWEANVTIVTNHIVFLRGGSENQFA